jgi:hypothetical protein
MAIVSGILTKRGQLDCKKVSFHPTSEEGHKYKLTAIRFGNLRLRTFIGWKSFGGVQPLDWGFIAVPAGISWAGVK